MKKNKCLKRPLAMLLALMILVSTLMVTPALAKEDEPVEKSAELIAAEILHKLGLFLGYGDDEDGAPVFGLEDGATRLHGIIMLLRYLGVYDEAQEGDNECLFADVTGAYNRAIVGYAFAMGYTKGVSATRFDPTGTLTATMYLTFILRALGYEDGIDFEWDAAWEMSDELEITKGEYNTENNSLRRGQMVLISLFALQQQVKGSEQTLIEVLIEAGVFDNLEFGADEIAAIVDEAIRSISDSEEEVETPDVPLVEIPAGGGGNNGGNGSTGSGDDDGDIIPLALVLSMKIFLLLEGSSIIQEYVADIVDINGNTHSVPVDELTYLSRVSYEGKVVEFTEDSAGMYGNFSVAAPNDSSKGWLINTGITAIENGAFQLTGSAGGNVDLVNNSTMFVVVNYKTENGNRILTNTVTIYNGIKSIPNLTVNGGLKSTYAVSCDTGSGVDAIAEIVYIYDDVYGIGYAENFVPSIALVISFDSYLLFENDRYFLKNFATIIDINGQVYYVPTDRLSNNSTIYEGKIVEFTLDKNGMYGDFVVAASDDSSKGWLINTGITAIVNGSTQLIGSAGGNVDIASSSTKFVVVNYKTENGKRVPDGSVTIYNINQVPSFSIVGGLRNTFAVSYNTSNGVVDEIAEIIYIYDDVYRYITFKLVFILGTLTQYQNGFTVNVFIDGEFDTILLTNLEDVNLLLSHAGKLLDEVKIDAFGVLYPGYSA